MTDIRAPTLVQLILLGSLVVLLPLIAAIVTAIVKVDGFAHDNREALASVQRNASTSRALADRVMELERTARQYVALGDPAYLALYAEHRKEVLAMFETLTSLNERSELLDPLEEARRAEEAAHATFGRDREAVDAQTLEAAFAKLGENVRTIVQAHNALARELGNAILEQAALLQRLLLSQALFVIPLSIGLAGLLGYYVSRSLQQVDHGIRSLGRGELGTPIRVRGARDLDELGERLEWLRVRLVELETQKAEFLRNVSHELKTPLTNIREGVELLGELREDRAETSETRTILRILRGNSIRLQQLIEQLLRYGSDGSLDSTRVNALLRVDGIVEDCIERIRPSLEVRSIRLERSLASATVLGNGKRLQVIVDNLLSNAVKYTPCGGRITLSLARDQGQVVLEVADTGPGVRAEDTERLFEWFYTGPKPVDAVVSGTGIGLAISQEYAQELSGRIELVQSGRGARFRLVLAEAVDEMP